MLTGARGSAVSTLLRFCKQQFLKLYPNSTDEKLRILQSEVVDFSKRFFVDSSSKQLMIVQSSTSLPESAVPVQKMDKKKSKLRRGESDFCLSAARELSQPKHFHATCEYFPSLV